MIRIVTDTTAGLSPEFLDAYQIPMVPQYLHFGQETYLDYFDVSPTQFFTILAQAPDIPKTSAPPVGDFIQLYRRMLDETPDATILCIHPSAEVSGTVRSALPAAAEFPQADIRIFDTRTCSVGLGMMVERAADMVRRGAEIDEVWAALEHMRDTLHVFFVVETLEYLAKGGRIGRASHLLGTLLDIKPILTMVDGVVESHSKARTRKRSIAEMARLATEMADRRPGLYLGVAHAVCEDEARALADELAAALQPEKCMFTEIGPAIGVHTGPGTLAVGWFHG
jgi:DegV family protein with EDD domain